jgi:hypothetical protein
MRRALAVEIQKDLEKVLGLDCSYLSSTRKHSMEYLSKA